MDLNSVHVSGRLTADPVGRRSGEGRAIATFRLAIERDREHVDFFKVTCFDRLASSVLSFLGRSSRVIVAGRLAQREQDRVEIIATDVHFLDGAKKRRDDPDDPNTRREPGELREGATTEAGEEADPEEADPRNDR